MKKPTNNIPKNWFAHPIEVPNIVEPDLETTIEDLVNRDKMAAIGSIPYFGSAEENETAYFYEDEYEQMETEREILDTNDQIFEDDDNSIEEGKEGSDNDASSGQTGDKAKEINVEDVPQS